MKRRRLLGGAAASAGLVALSQRSHAQTFPDRPVRFVVPYAPGGSTDTCTRIIAERMSVLFGQPVIVDNKPGGGTIIATEIVAKAKPDGYTILLTPGALAVNAAFGISLPYDSVKDLAPIARFVAFPSWTGRTKTIPVMPIWTCSTSSTWQWYMYVPGSCDM